MVEDESLSKLNALYNSVKSKEERQNKMNKIYPKDSKVGYKYGKREDIGYHSKLTSNYKGIHSDVNSLKDYEKGFALKQANGYLAEAQRSGDVDSALMGLKMYDMLGLANRVSVKRRFVKAFEKAKYVSSERIKEARDLLEKVSKQSPSSSLENKTLTSVFALFTLAGLFFGINGFTGAVIGTQTNTSGFLGGILFILGILGFFVSKK